MGEKLRVYLVADLVLDPSNRRLTRAGTEVYLPPKTFDTLLLLVERHGQLVTKRELLDRVWSETAVTDNALTQQISELREVLGDDARQPRFIRTLPRVGFTFIAAVESIPGLDRTDGGRADDSELPRAGTISQTAPVLGSFSEPGPPLNSAIGARVWSPRPGLSPRDAGHPSVSLSRWVGVAATAVLAMAGAIWWVADRPNSAPRLELVSSSPGLHRSPSLSPDGRTVAFVSDRAGTSQVWLKSLAGGDPIQLTFHEEPVVRPRWSPLGDQIVYSVQGRGIWSVPPLGGKPRQLIDVGWNPEISPDGRLLVFERRFSVWTANSDGTNPRQLTTLKRGYIAYYGDAWPTFSPDGTHIAVFLGEKGIHGDYWIVPVEEREPRRVTFDVTEGGPPAWTPDGKHLVVSSARAGSLTLWRIPVSGGTPEALTTGAGEDLDPEVSSDGRRLLFTNVKRTWSLVVHDTHNGSRRTLLETRTSLLCPRFSWDGRQVAFFGKNASGDTHLFTVDANGANLLQVTTGRGGLNIMPQWSNDNRALFYYQVNPSWSFRRIAATGGPSEEIARWTWEREHEASTDPSSRRIAYSVLEQGRLHETRIRRLDDGQEITLPVAVFQPQFSRDGRFIAGGSRDREVTVCEIGGGCRAITEGLDGGLAAIAWSRDGARVFYLQRTSQEGWGELKSIGVDGRTQQTHGSFGPIGRVVMFIGVSPSDEIVFAPYIEGPHELWMLELP